MNMQKPDGKETLSSQDKENLKANYLKLWLMEKTNFPFVVHVQKMRQEWGLPIKTRRNVDDITSNLVGFFRAKNQSYTGSKEFLKFVPTINSVLSLDTYGIDVTNALEHILTEIPALKFKNQVELLRNRFDFEQFWCLSLYIYVGTNFISPPYKEVSRNVPPKSIVEDWEIFNEVLKMKVTKDFLKKEKKTLEDYGEYAFGKENLFVFDYLHVARNVFGDWGEFSTSWLELEKEDKRKYNLVRKRYSRFKKYFVPLSDEDMGILKTLHSTTAT